jgi:hypothetical protein
MPADPILMRQLQDGKANLLFVGRLAPNKRQEHLVSFCPLFDNGSGGKANFSRVWLL